MTFKGHLNNREDYISCDTGQSDLEQALVEIERLKKENQRLFEENDHLKKISSKGKFHSSLEHYSKHILTLAEQIPGQLAIALFSCVEELSFDPFKFAMDNKNQSLSSGEVAPYRLKPGENWYGRFVGYYSSLDSHLLDFYKTMKNEDGGLLLDPNQPTLTGVRSDPNSPVFNHIIEKKAPFWMFLEKEKYGFDLLVRAFPILGEEEELIGMVTYTHDITLHLDHQKEIAGGLNDIKDSANKLYGEIEIVQEVARQLGNLSSDIDFLQEVVEGALHKVDMLDDSFSTDILQMKTLALNTKIEAARSGSAGTKFRVIADESHDLVRKMANTVGRLKELIGSIQTLKKESLDKLTDVNSLTEKINSTADNLQTDGKTLTEFVKTIDKAAEYTDEFIKAMID